MCSVRAANLGGLWDIGIRDKPDRSSHNRNALTVCHRFGDGAERCWNLATLFDATSGCYHERLGA